MAVNAYAGIGSRKTPPEICDMMTGFASLAESLGWVLRSGHAEGADIAFENGVKEALHKEIYIPWGSFNGSASMLFPPSPVAMEMASKVHPNWEACSSGAKKLHARNIHQILGKALIDPVKFVVCWTPDGNPVGGTATALRVAAMYHVPVFNLANLSVNEEARLEGILRSLPK